MGGRGGTAGGGRAGGAPERLTKAQKDAESRQIETVQRLEKENRSAAENAVRDAMNVAITAAESGRPDTWRGFSGAEISNLAKEVFNDARREQRKTGADTGQIKQETANRIVREAIQKQAKSYDRKSRAVEGKMRQAYERRFVAQGREKPTTGLKKRQFDMVVSAATNLAMGKIFSNQGFSTNLKSANLPLSFLRSNLNAAVAALK